MYQKIKDEIIAVRNACENHILKVILETFYLTKEEKLIGVRIVAESGVDFVKTTTGFAME